MTDSTAGAGVAEVPESLRQRKKRLMRQLISDTATEMFLDRGFDEVRVSDIAAACGISEKTIFNYFTSKEALLLDREAGLAEAIRVAFGVNAPPRSPIDAALALLEQDLDRVTRSWEVEHDGGETLRRFADLVDNTPSLRAAERDMMERLVRVAAEAMAERLDVSPEDPEPQIAAHAILGLWQIQFQSLRRHADGLRTPQQVNTAVTAEVRRAGRLIESGLWSFGLMVQGQSDSKHVDDAAAAAIRAGRQIAVAMRRAQKVWQHLQDEKARHDRDPRHGPHGRGWSAGPRGPRGHR